MSIIDNIRNEFGKRELAGIAAIVVIGGAAVGVGVATGALTGDDDPDDIAPQMQENVDRLEAEGDCSGLQFLFDSTRDDAADQLTYINNALRDAGCYD